MLVSIVSGRFVDLSIGQKFGFCVSAPLFGAGFSPYGHGFSPLFGGEFSPLDGFSVWCRSLLAHRVTPPKSTTAEEQVCSLFGMYYVLSC